MTPRLVKNEQDYEKALERIEELMDARANTARGDELELLTTLVELYEQEHYPIDLPDPIEALRFRMEQQNLTQRDLIPFMGSRSKVSEVLRRKRSLSLNMIRRLHQGLGIPAEVLLQKPGASIPEDAMTMEWQRFPITDMAKRNWFESFRGTASDGKEQAEELLRSFFASINLTSLQEAHLKQQVRSGSQLDEYALLAWRARVLQIAEARGLTAYEGGSVTEDFMRQLAHLSYLDEGPRLAQEFLAKSGIAFVVLRHLPRTHLDGAAFWGTSPNPIVALTLRYDRLDNLWFTLFHELAHIKLHLDHARDESFIDDDFRVEGNQVESEADSFATDMLIAPDVWESADVRRNREPGCIREFAESLRIHPAIVAGRIRRESRNYRILAKVVGHGEVRRQFHNIDGAVSQSV